MHVHLQTAALFGNSTGLEYFYVNVFLGSNRQKQSLIVDTGSNIAAVPCRNYCSVSVYGKQSCGDHINQWYDIDRSTSKHFFDCQKEKKCRCTKDNRCLFGQSYLEGSSYEGFWVKDSMHFGEEFHPKLDAFNFTFGCISKETNLFYTQKADGILGMGTGFDHGIEGEKPIYEAMIDAKIIRQRMFTICLGLNGGYFQIGGFNTAHHVEPINWYKFTTTRSQETFTFPIIDVIVGNEYM